MKEGSSSQPQTSLEFAGSSQDLRELAESAWLNEPADLDDIDIDDLDVAEAAALGCVAGPAKPQILRPTSKERVSDAARDTSAHGASAPAAAEHKQAPKRETAPRASETDAEQALTSETTAPRASESEAEQAPEREPTAPHASEADTGSNDEVGKR